MVHYINLFWTKIGKFNIVLIFDVSIARLIPMIKLALVYYEKLYVTICSVFILYEIKMKNKINNFFFLSNWDFFCLELRKNILLGISAPKPVIESPDCRLRSGGFSGILLHFLKSGPGAC